MQARGWENKRRRRWEEGREGARVEPACLHDVLTAWPKCTFTHQMQTNTHSSSSYCTLLNPHSPLVPLISFLVPSLLPIFLFLHSY